MATYVKFDSWAENMVEAANLGSDTLKVCLTNTQPTASTDSVYGDITEITAQNGYSAGGTQATISSSSQSSGTYKLVLADVTFTASGGSFGPFQYAVLYDDTVSSPSKPLIAYWAYTSSISVASGDSFVVDFDPTNGVIQLS